MPPTMRRLAWVQIFTWLGFFCMWLYFGVAVARNIFGGAPGTPAYDQGIAWAGNCFAMYSAVCFAFSFALPAIAARLGRRLTHALCLLMRRRRPDLGGLRRRQVLAPAADGGRGHRLGQHPRDAVRHPGRRPARREDRHLHGHLQLLHRHPGDPGRARVRHAPGAAPHRRERAGAAGSAETIAWPSSSSAASRWRWPRRSARPSSTRPRSRPNTLSPPGRGQGEGSRRPLTRPRHPRTSCPAS